MLPFIAFIIFQIPAPVTTVGVLYISIGTDLIPAISLAYELGELDLMTRKPRSKEDHMVTMTLMAQAYGYMGWIEFWGGMIAYYAVFNDFGFPPSQLMMTANAAGYSSNAGDIYNPSHPTFGNTYLYQTYIAPGGSGFGKCPGTGDANYSMIDWVYLQSSTYDLRVIMLNCSPATGKAAVFTQMINWGSCNVQQISPYTNKPVCFTTEACKYAQTAYFIGIVICQICNVFACKTRKLSVISQGASNTFLLFAITTEIMLVLGVTFVYPLNVGFGFRDNIFMHYGTPALPFAMILLVVDECRKYFIRSLPEDDTGKPHWFPRAALW
jgi:sodium/potassium-transporting ATPase subunit alpha